MRSSSSPAIKFIKRALFTLFILVALGGTFLVFYVMSSVRAVEDMVVNIGDKIQTYNSKPTRIVSADGKLLFELRPVYRDSVSLSDVPKHVRNAFLAAEDKRFYSHPGVDIWGLARASVEFLKDRGASQGGSTITMQLAKRLFSASQRTMQRKVQDISIAIQMERKFTKDDILELYMNQVFFGEQAYGIAAASEIYFGKKVDELSIGEAAMLARCVRLPSTENPVIDYSAAINNRNTVLKTMLDESMITDSQYEKAKAERPKIIEGGRKQSVRVYAAPYFVAAIQRELSAKGIKWNEGGYTVTTTLDLGLQQRAEEETRVIIRRNRGRGVNVASFICCDSEGRVLADVGGIDFKANQYSYTRQSRLQPGSSFKAFVYAEALQENLINENSEISNAKLVLPGESKNKPYVPRNSHGGYGGDVSLWSAFTQSINVPAVRTLMMLKPKHAADVIAEDFGFETKLAPYAPLALGATAVKPIEMAEAYTVFLLDGRRVKPYSITEVSDADGEVIIRGGISFATTRIGPETCQIMDKLMRGVVTNGTGRAASMVDEARGKTGTTNGGKSVWFCGYAKGIVGIAWAGSNFYDKKRKRWLLREMPESFGGDVAAPLWGAIMQEATARFGSDAKPNFAQRPEPVRKKKPVKPEEEVLPVGEDGTNVPEDPSTAPAIRDPEETGTDDPTGKPKGETPPVVPPIESPPETPKTEKPKKEKPRNTEDDSEVEVEVCADSGKLATRYCPETVSRKFAKSKRPRGRCTLHKAPDEGGTGGGAHQ